jgi:Lysophospholipase L1 and related esterases
MKRFSLCCILFVGLSFYISAQNSIWKFSFGTSKTEKGTKVVPVSTAYSDELEYGFDFGTHPQEFTGTNGKKKITGCKSDKPFYFSVKLPEGNYDVKLVLGGADEPSLTTVRAESRRLMLAHIATAKGATTEQSFTVNVRNARINDSLSVKIKLREKAKLNWDNKLTLEFGDKNAAISSIEITPNTTAPTIFLCGNSTVVDQDNDPWCGWGQMFPSFFKKDVAIANYAESGEAANTFISARRLEKLLTKMKKGDFLFMEFGHNDQKQKGDGIGPWGSYQKALQKYIDEARKHGAFPVIVTSMHRRNFDADGKVINTLGEYPEAARQLAQKNHVPLIDLNAMSKILYEAWGPEQSVKAFVHYKAGTFAGQTNDLADNTHFNAYGGYELSKCIVEGCIADKLDFVKYLRSEYKRFDPAHPDAFESVSFPLSPFTTVEKPDGN